MKTTEKMALRCRDARACRPAVIACLGDSVTHGCFELVDLPDGRFDTTYRPHEGYPAKLQRRLNALFPAAAPCVLDAGISGDSARGGLERLERDVLSVRPDLVIVNFGLNDACGQDA
ncbi:MAG: GDSL family lipase, partial [Clostridia bacterium]|nr:GDSL family lipase [Clostridia bacterium]